MSPHPSRLFPLWLGLLIVVAGVLPVGLYWPFFENVPTVSPAAAKRLLARSDPPTVLVDVRPSEAFKTRHLDGAVNWPFEEIRELKSAQDLPEQLRDKTLLLVCESGMSSALAVRKLRDRAVRDVRNVRGGMQAWVGTADEPCGQSFCNLRLASGDIKALPFREAPGYEQWIAVISGFVIKPTYMLLSLVLVAVLWRQKSRELVALRWALISFFAGEAFCAVNFLVYKELSLLFEYLHSYGMVLAFGFTTYAFFEGLDARMIHYSDTEKKCAALGLCRSCIKHGGGPCGLKRLFLFLLPVMLLLAFMPLVADPKVVSYNTRIWGTFYNYTHFVPHQVYEIRYCPLLAILLFAASFLVLVFRKQDPMPAAKILLACGAGFLSFGLFRLFLFAPYVDNLVWFVFWEEMTEMIYVAGVGVVLWVFPRLLQREAVAP
jgi:rhodanese-related sulfurtransferase